MAPSSNENLKEKKSKFRLSNPFKAPKDAKLATPAEQNGPTDGRVSNLNVPAVDSTYGSAEATPGSSTGQVPTMTEAQAAAQNAPMKTHTDGATGRTITTTTTTTTTTVTTTDGEHIQVPPGQEVVVQEDGAEAENGLIPTAVAPNVDEPSELSARPISRTNSQPPKAEQGPPIPPKDNRRNASPAAQPGPYAAGALSQGYNGPSYDTATSPVSPEDSRAARQNFSYPARTPPATSAHAGGGARQYAAYPPPAGAAPPSRFGTGAEPLRPPDSAGVLLPPPSTGQTWGYGREPAALRADGRPSTFANLKTAAAGIHGASEALRGALNASLERHTGGDEARIAAHDDVAARGRREVETGRFVRPQHGVEANGAYAGNSGNADMAGVGGSALSADQTGPVGGYSDPTADGVGVGNGNANGNGDFQVKRKGLRKKLWKGKEDVP